MSALVKAAFRTLQMPLVLGSRSPRRLELLASVGLSVIERPADVDEAPTGVESPGPYVERVTRAKLARACALVDSELGPQVAVLVADTTVTIDGEILGKPESERHAVDMLRRLAGRTHDVLTCYGLEVVSTGSPRPGLLPPVLRTVATRVSMRPCSSGDLERYVASGEPFGKAGAYAIQGLGAALVERIEGSYTGVVGLPLCEVLLDLERSGVVEPLE